MPTAKYTAAIRRFTKAPNLLVKLTVPGDIAGSQLFRFSYKEMNPIHLQIDEDVRAYLMKYRGRPTIIKSEQNLTERGSITLTFWDDPNAPAFDSAVFSVTTGGSFFQRLILTQPDIVGSTVEVLRGFNETGFAECDFLTIFKGRVEDFSFQPNGIFSLICKDIFTFIDRQAPMEIDDDNLITAIISSDDSSFTVTDGSEITDPANFTSQDYMPVVIRIDDEDIIVRSISDNIVTVQNNHLNHSENFAFTTPNGWTATVGTTITSDNETSPFGGSPLADKLAFAAAGTDRISQDSGAIAASTNYQFSVWLRTTTETTGTITIRLEDEAGTPAGAELQVSLTSAWARFNVSVQPFGAGAVGTVNCFIKRESGDLDEVYAFGAQLEKQPSATGRLTYVGTTTNRGDSAGRGAFGSTAAGHSEGVEFKEVLVYRNHLDEDGINPVTFYRDILARSEILAADINTTIFDQEFAFQPGYQIRRGRSSDQDDSTIIKATNTQNHINEVSQESLMDMWVAEDGRIEVRWSWRALNVGVGAIPTTLTDEDEIGLQSLRVLGNREFRATRIYIYFNRIGTESGDKREHYRKVTISADVTPEVFSGPKTKPILAKWLYRSIEAGTLGSRFQSRFLRGARIVECTVDIKDDPDITLGDLLNLNALEVPIKFETTAIRGDVVFQVRQKSDITPEGKMRIMLLEGRPGRYCNISDLAGLDYDDELVTADDQAEFGWISDTNLKLGTANDETYIMQ